MNQSYRYFIVLLACLCTHSSFAQLSGSLKGLLKDSKEEAVSFANVALLQAADSSLVSGAVTDMDGNFQLKSPEAGRYMLRLSAIGFTNQYTAPFEVSGPEYEKDFGTLTLQEDVKVLGEVKVQAMRPTVVNEVDKMVVSIEGTALAAGSTALEMLEKAPGVWIDQDGNIQLNGKGGVRVMIDGRASYLSAKELQSMLQSMSAENIKDIELITNPSAKYDAEGSSGIINIRLKKNRLNGVNGSVSSGYRYNGNHTYNTSANVNFKKGKWNSFLNAESSSNTRIRDAKMYREFNSEYGNFVFDQVGYENQYRFNHSVRLGTDYEINSRHSVGVMANFSLADEDDLFQTDTDLTNVNTGTGEFTDASNQMYSSNFNSTFNMHYKGELDTLGTTLSADVNYIRLSGESSSDFDNVTKDLNGASIGNTHFYTDNPSQFDIHSAQVDFTKTLFGNTKVETGVKASYVISDNARDFYTYQDNQKLLTDSLTDRFVFKEQIYAGYVSMSRKLGEKWTAKAGVRAEQTINNGYSYTLNQETERNYLNFFPSLFLQRIVNKDYQVSLNYSKRINRPHYGNLNPYMAFLDLYTRVQGNPYLRPEYSHTVAMTHTLMRKFNLIMEYQYTTDQMSEVPIQDNTNNTTIFWSMNVDRRESFNVTLVAPVQVSKAWEFSNTAFAAYQKNAILLDGKTYDNNQLFFFARSNHNFMLPKGIRLQLNAVYRGPVAWGMYSMEGMWWMEAGLKKSFMNDKLDLSLNVNDIFRTMQVKGTANRDQNINSFDQYFGAQSVRINLRYRFNKGEKFKSRNQNVNLDELNRAGG